MDSLIKIAPLSMFCSSGQAKSSSPLNLDRGPSLSSIKILRKSARDPREVRQIGFGSKSGNWSALD